MSQTESNKDIKRIAAKIAKCLALANSDNPAEAEAAKRQAEALMKKHGLTDADITASTVKEQATNTGSKHRPPLWIAALASIVGDAFSCEPLLSLGGGCSPTQIRFVGIGHKPELAAYTFEVLHRQLKKHRREFIATQKRVKRSTKTRRADLFCQSWVGRIGVQVKEFAGTEAEKAAIAAYKEKQYSDLNIYKKKTAKPKHNNDHLAAVAGHRAASDVSLNKPVQTKQKAYLGNTNG